MSDRTPPYVGRTFCPKAPKPNTVHGFEHGVVTIYGTLHATNMVIGDIISFDYTTGEVTYLPGFTTTDAAALAFWEAVKRLAPRE